MGFLITFSSLAPPFPLADTLKFRSSCLRVRGSNQTSSTPRAKPVGVLSIVSVACCVVWCSPKIGCCVVWCALRGVCCVLRGVRCVECAVRAAWCWHVHHEAAEPGVHSRYSCLWVDFDQHVLGLRGSVRVAAHVGSACVCARVCVLSMLYVSTSAGGGGGGGRSLGVCNVLANSSGTCLIVWHLSSALILAAAAASRGKQRGGNAGARSNLTV